MKVYGLRLDLVKFVHYYTDLNINEYNAGPRDRGSGRRKFLSGKFSHKKECVSMSYYSLKTLDAGVALAFKIRGQSHTFCKFIDVKQ